MPRLICWNAGSGVGRMSNQDMKPTSDTYAKRWHFEDTEAFEAEVQAQKQYVFQDEIIGDFGKRFKVRETDRISSFKRLCALATHPSAAEQNKRARTIGSQVLFETLCTYMKNGNDVMQYWTGLLMLQLLHQNIACCTIFLQCKGLNTVAEMIARAEVTMSKTERGESAFDDYAAFFEKPCSQHTLFVCLMIASNISHFFTESHEFIRGTEAPWSFRAQGKDKSLPPPPGILTVCAAIIRRGRTLEYPTFDAAIRLVHSLSSVQSNILPLMRADVTRVMRKHYEAETSEGPACKATAANIQAFAAVMVQKHVRGHAGRNLVSHAKANRLKKFYSNFKKKTYFRGWKRFTADMQRVKKFFKNIFDRREKYGVKNSFKRWAQYTAWFREIERDAHTFFTWESSRNLLFCEWVDFLRNEVAELNAKVQAKCKTVLVLITGEVFKNCIQEWKGMVQKSKVIKRRWLHGSKDTAMRKWKKFISDIHSKMDDASDRLRVLCRHLTGDFASAAFHEWSEVCRKKKIAVRRLFHRRLFFGWDGWLEHMDETFEVIRQVNVKCAHIVSLLSGDLVNVCFQECHKYAVRRITTRRVTKAYREKLVDNMWRVWLRRVTSTARTEATIRQRCSSIVHYISHGACVECFAMWKDRVNKRRRATRMFTHACLIRCLHVWTHEILARARTIKRAKTRMTKYLEHYFLRLWAFNVRELFRQRDTIDRIAFRMQNRCLVMCFTQWMHWTSETIYTRQVVTKIRRTYEIRVVREPLQKWYMDSRHSSRLKRLVYRIKNRAVQLGFEEMAKMLEESKLRIKEAMLEKSTLIARWLKRPMVECWTAWSVHCEELRRRDQLLKRLRYRMLNAGAVRAISEWQHMIRLNKEERRQMLYFAVADAVKNGASSQLRATLSSHAIWTLRYSRGQMKDAMQELLARDLSSLPIKGRPRRDAAVFHGGRRRKDGELVTGTSIHACLLLVDHFEAAVRAHAICKLRLYMHLWRTPWQARRAGCEVDMLVEDMPHADDIVAAVQQRRHDDADAQVRKEAEELLAQYAAPSSRRSKIDLRCLSKEHCWQRINTPMATLAALHSSRLACTAIAGSDDPEMTSQTMARENAIDDPNEGEKKKGSRLEAAVVGDDTSQQLAHDDFGPQRSSSAAQKGSEHETGQIEHDDGGGQDGPIKRSQAQAAVHSQSDLYEAPAPEQIGALPVGMEAAFILTSESSEQAAEWDHRDIPGYYYDAATAVQHVVNSCNESGAAVVLPIYHASATTERRRVPGGHGHARHSEDGGAKEQNAHQSGERSQLNGAASAKARRDPGQRQQDASSRAHAWAQTFAFSSKQESRTKSLVEVALLPAACWCA